MENAEIFTTKEKTFKNGAKCIDTYNQEGRQAQHVFIRSNGEKIETEYYKNCKRTSHYAPNGTIKRTVYLNAKEQSVVMFRYDANGKVIYELTAENLSEANAFMTEHFYENGRLVKKTEKSQNFQSVINYKENGDTQILALENGQITAEVVTYANAAQKFYRYENGHVKEFKSRDTNGNIISWKTLNPKTGEIVRDYAEEMRQANDAALYTKIINTSERD